MKKRCLITGATGLIGSNLFDELEPSWEAIGLTQRDNPSGPAKYIKADLSGEWNKNSLPASVDAVVHLAQSGRFREFPVTALEVFRVNTESTIRLADYALAAGARTFVYASTGGVYGFSDEPFSEDEPLTPGDDLGFYAETKLCSERLLLNYAKHMSVIILRFFFVYGPGQKKDMLIPRLVDSVRDGRPVMLHGADGIRINPVYVTDAAAAIVKAISLEGSHKINVGGPEVLSLREIASEIGAGLCKEPVFDVKPSVEPRNLIGDIRKMSAMLVPPSVSFSDGIRRYINSMHHG